MGKSLEQEFTAHYGLAVHIARAGLRYEDGTELSDQENLVQEAIAFAWKDFPRVTERNPDRPAKSRVRWAVKHGVWRVKRGGRIAPTRVRGYRDALDGASASERDHADRPATGYRDPTDRTLAEQIIEQLPTLELQAIARLFSYGLTKEDVAQRRGISRSKLYLLIAELRKLIPQALPQPDEAFIAAIRAAESAELATNRFSPVASLSPSYARLMRAIGMEHEHNRCDRQDVVVHVDPFTGHIVLDNPRRESFPVA